MPGEDSNKKSPEEVIAGLQLAFGVVADSLKMYYLCLKTTGIPDKTIDQLLIGMQIILMAPVIGTGGNKNDK